MRNERWAFSESELADPYACNSYDELLVSVPDPSDPKKSLEQGIIIYRNGTVSNRWEDGTAGVPAEVVELANEEETLYHPDDDLTEEWRDVCVDDNGNFAAWAGPTKRAP
jgi:hypothetical protein